MWVGTKPKNIKELGGLEYSIMKRELSLLKEEYALFKEEQERKRISSI